MKHPSRSGDSRTEISSESSSSDEPGEGADNDGEMLESNADMDEPRDWGNTWTQYQPWVVTDEFWEETPRIEGWQEDMPAAPTLDPGDEDMPTLEEPQEVTSMDTSQGRKRTGTVPARFTSYNDRMRRTNSKPDHRHRQKSSGKKKRDIVSNKNRNLTETGGPSQETQPRRPTPTTREPAIITPTTVELTTARTPAFTDHEDRKRKPKSTAERAAKMKTERSRAQDKSHTKRRGKQTLLEKIAGPLIPPPPYAAGDPPSKGGKQ